MIYKDYDIRKQYLNYIEIIHFSSSNSGETKD